MPPAPSAREPTGSSQSDPTPTGPYLGDSTAGPSPVPTPHRIGRFEVRSALGQGAFGTVYRAYDPQLDREVAVKVPHFPPNRPDLVERFLREARSAARLRHPGIVATFEVGTASGEQFIACELVTGQTLRARMDQAPRPTLRQAVGWVRDLALALEYAHGQGIVHRDIKPTNIMVDAQNRAQLMDFGLAKRVDLAGPVPLAGEGGDTGFVLGPAVGDAAGSDASVVQDTHAEPPAGGSATYAALTAEGAVVGTPAYMSPEQARGTGDAVGPASDQYSLGVVLYELLTGRQPFAGSVIEILRQVTDPACPVRSPCDLNTEAPRPLAGVCLKALAKEPAQRFGSAADLAVDLQRWLNNQPVRAYQRPRRGADQGDAPTQVLRQMKKVRRLPDWCRARPRWMLAALLGLLLVGLVAGTSRYVVALRAQSVAARRAADIVRCDLYRERGRGQNGKALRFAAESLALALELKDADRQQAAAEVLAASDWPLPRPPGMDGNAGLQWDLAAHLLLGRQLAVGGEWEKLGERLQHAGNGQRTGFGAGGQKVLTDRPPNPLFPNSAPRLFKDARTGEPFGRPVPGENSIIFASGGHRALRIGSFRKRPRNTRNTSVVLWDLDSGEVLGPKPSEARHAGFSPDGSKFVVLWLQTGSPSGDRSEPGRQSLLAQVWNVATVKPVTEPVEVARGKPGPRDIPIAGTWTQWTWHGTNTHYVADQDGTGPAPDSAKFMVSNDGSTVVMGCPEARTWTIANRDEISSAIGIVLPGSKLSSCAAFHPGGRHLLVAGKERVELWDLSGERVGEFLPAKGAEEMLVSPDGGQLLTRSATGWQLWDMHTRRPAGLPLQRLGNVQRVDFHPGGRQLLTAADSDARLWPNPVVALRDRPAALRLCTEAGTGFVIEDAGELKLLEEKQQIERARRFAALAGLAP